MTEFIVLAIINVLGFVAIIVLIALAHNEINNRIDALDIRVYKILKAIKLERKRKIRDHLVSYEITQLMGVADSAKRKVAENNVDDYLENL